MEHYFHIKKVLCKCGCGLHTSLTYKNGKMFYKDYVVHHIFKDKCFIERNAKEMKISRAGENNPQYGKHSWNYGKTAKDNESMRKIS